MIHLFRSTRFLYALCFILVVPTIIASNSKIDLLRDRNALKLKVLEAILPEKRDQSDVLRDLEMRLASERDYKGAIQARDERLALEQEIAGLEKEIDALQSIPAPTHQKRWDFLAKDANLTECVLNESKQFITKIGANAEISWDLPSLAAGGYEVYISYSGTGAEAKIEESFYFLQATIPNTKGRLQEKRIGILRVKAESTGLKVTFPSSTMNPESKIAKISLVPCNL